MTVIALQFRGDEPLACPGCKGRNLHHDRVTVYDRQEDAAAVTVTEVERGMAVVRHVQGQGGNPSMRRHGIAIRFWCETCDCVAELTLAQHKGETEVEWRSFGHRAGSP